MNLQNHIESWKNILTSTAFATKEKSRKILSHPT